MNGNSLSHLDSAGEAHMVDVSDKSSSLRCAIAACEIAMSTQALDIIQAGNLPKGNVLNTAKLAGIMAAKQTAHLIPLCHPLPLSAIKVRIYLDENIPGYQIEAEVKTTASTGVEMEALTAASVAALTIYDMAKALDQTMVISQLRLTYKSGGKSGDFCELKKPG
ncbi:MAG: cyclic pyranopterin monophosphate synthase MoaC [Pseudanabaenaceae cyanobacterium bins.68]|nr:cyclic pyranopterin monophosphate synthase MoaC [Pseudanabaenaceae cyanobacterium bins.68]